MRSGRRTAAAPPRRRQRPPAGRAAAATAAGRTPAARVPARAATGRSRAPASTSPMRFLARAGHRRRRLRRGQMAPTGSARAGRSPARTGRAGGAARPPSLATSSAGRAVAVDGGAHELAEPVQRLGRAPAGRRPAASPATPADSATSRRSMSTNRPESGRSDQSALAVTWNSTMRPAPRGAAVTSGVPSASRAQVCSARCGARLGQHLARHLSPRPAPAGPRTASRCGNGASPAGLLQDSEPPSWRSPASSLTGSSAVRVLRRLGAGEADQQTALAPPRLASWSVLRPVGDDVVGQDQHRQVARQQRVDVALAHLGDTARARGADRMPGRSAACRQRRRRRRAMPTGRRRQRSSSSTTEPAEDCPSSVSPASRLRSSSGSFSVASPVAAPAGDA